VLQKPETLPSQQEHWSDSPVSMINTASKQMTKVNINYFRYRKNRMTVSVEADGLRQNHKKSL